MIQDTKRYQIKSAKGTLREQYFFFQRKAESINIQAPDTPTKQKYKR